MPVPLATLRKLLRARAPLRELRRLVDQPPPPWPEGERGQGTLWVTVEGAELPWPRAPYRERRWWCIGCGRERVAKRHTYCRRCRRRVEADVPVDVDDVLTQGEARRRGLVSNPGRR